VRITLAPLRDFLQRESISGVLILLASAAGLLIANSPLSDEYFEVLAYHFSIGSGALSIDLSILKVINYVLMTIFFFVAGLEIKREITSGHLASKRAAMLPLLAAIGGMVVPAIIYLLIAGREEASGWGVPVATDIALAVGLLTMVGTSATTALRSFLLALAVIDDIGAILIIAFVYSSGLKAVWIPIAALSVLAIVVAKRWSITFMPAYIFVGILLWFSLYKVGVHPTLAGVILGMLTPNIAHKNSGLEDLEDGSVSVIEWLEHKCHPYSTFLIVPLFAFANTGVVINQSSLSAAIASVVAWGIFFGLVLGKPIGILIASILAKRAKIAVLPTGATAKDILATGSAAGIGFTVAIFIAKLAFDDVALQELAVMAVIAASVVSAVLSLLLFKLFSKSHLPLS
jgi:NhaA family Na+:H+ antiporter